MKTFFIISRYSNLACKSTRKIYNNYLERTSFALVKLEPAGDLEHTKFPIGKKGMTQGLKKAMANALNKPKLIAFDLDYTLWPFWVDTHVTPPFKKERNGNVTDITGRNVKYFPEVPSILEKLHKEGYILAAVSRTSEIRGANQLLELFDWNKYFTYKEIYPGSKKTHFNAFKKQSGIEFKDMLFFDDEFRNIRDLTEHGVTSIHVNEDRGVTWEVVEEGLKAYRSKSKD